MGTENLKHRKDQVKIRFLQEDGTPIANTAVGYEQKAHEFLFGCGAFETVNITSPADEASKAFYEERMEKWLQIFNFATLPFYWQRFEPEKGITMAEDVRKAALWLKKRGIRLKGHPLCWHTQTAPWLYEMQPEQILQEQRTRIRREVADFRGLIDMWDVINEVVIMPVFEKEENGITKLCQNLGRVEMVRQMFEEARATNPGGIFLINDFNTSESYAQLIEQCLEAGIRLDAIGIQSHQHQGYWGQEKLYRILERFSRFGLPIHFTENTFISGHLMPPEIVDLNDYQIPEWPTTPEGEERQAENVVEFYKILFAHPQVEAITTWAFQDGAWLGAPAGLVHTDNSEKPAYYALKELIRKNWWTKGVSNTDAEGSVILEGFKGCYEATVGGRRLPFSIGEGKQEITLVV